MTPFIARPILLHPTISVEIQDAPEKLALIRTIRRLMDFWRIEPDELAGVEPLAPAPEHAAEPVTAEPPPPRHYRHPIFEYEWDGCGAQPQWLKDALIREGYTVEELRQAASITPPPRQTSPS